jgi:spore photoproduct lyase
MEMSDAPWESLNRRLRIETETAARNILLLELKPLRDVRLEAFPNMSTRADFFFGTQGINCPYRCEYCYLYSNSAGIIPLILYTDLDVIFEQVNRVIQRNTAKLTFNFGEDTDSLATEHITGTAGELISFFSQSAARLELRTKSRIANDLIGIRHCGKTTIGISLSPPRVANKYEHFTAPVEDRLRAAAIYTKADYEVALKFEPGILIDNWESMYVEFVRTLPNWFQHQTPAHISLGCFRYRSELGDAIRRNYPRSQLLQGANHEYVPGRFSYSLDLRRKFYRMMIDELRVLWSDIPIYLSMESEELCQELGADPWLPVEVDTGLLVTAAA